MSIPDPAIVRRIVNRWSRRDIAQIYRQGYVWVRDVFEPAVRALEEAGRTRRNRVLAAEGRYQLGDVHEFNHAPLAAIREYRRSLANFELSGAWREISSLQNFTGQSAAAARSARKALLLDPGDYYAQSELECSLNPRDRTLYRTGDTLWRAREFIDSGSFRKALQLLRFHRSIDARQIRARAWGALGETETVLREWEEIVVARGPVKLEYADHFYLPKVLDDDPRWWRLLWRVRRRDQSGCWDLPPSFFDHPELFQRPDGQQRISLCLRYNISRTEQNARALSDIVRQLVRRFRQVKDIDQDWEKVLQALASKELPPKTSSVRRVAGIRPSKQSKQAVTRDFWRATRILRSDIRGSWIPANVYFRRERFFSAAGCRWLASFDLFQNTRAGAELTLFLQALGLSSDRDWRRLNDQKFFEGLTREMRKIGWGVDLRPSFVKSQRTIYVDSRCRHMKDGGWVEKARRVNDRLPKR